MIFALGMTLCFFAVTPIEERDIAADPGKSYRDNRSLGPRLRSVTRTTPTQQVEETPRWRTGQILCSCGPMRRTMRLP
jgi:hypothetical protein